MSKHEEFTIRDYFAECRPVCVELPDYRLYMTTAIVPLVTIPPGRQCACLRERGWRINKNDNGLRTNKWTRNGRTSRETDGRREIYVLRGWTLLFCRWNKTKLFIRSARAIHACDTRCVYIFLKISHLVDGLARKKKRYVWQIKIFFFYEIHDPFQGR